jgi:hypothetical protein
MEIKEKARERMELRIYAQETLKTIIEWIQTVKPTDWIPAQGKGEDFISPDEVKAQWRDYISKGGALIAKAWKPAELLVDDLTGFMEEICVKPKSPPVGGIDAKHEGASESK